MTRPYVVRPDHVAARRAARTSSGEALGWVRSLVGEGPLRVDWIELPPGERVAPEHAHSARDEIFLVLAGTLTPIVEGMELEPIEPHALFVVPHGSATSTLRNVGERVATLLQIGVARADDVVRYAPEP